MINSTERQPAINDALTLVPAEISAGANDVVIRNDFLGDKDKYDSAPRELEEQLVKKANSA